MKRNRFWIEIIALVTMIACALALLIATLGAGAAAVGSHNTPAVPAAPQTQLAETPSPQAYDGPTQTYEGMVTCSRCQAKHPAKMDRSASNCTLVCIHGGAAFALVDGEKAYQLKGDLGVLKRFAGQRAQITGVAHGDTIDVSSVASVAAAS